MFIKSLSLWTGDSLIKNKVGENSGNKIIPQEPKVQIWEKEEWSDQCTPPFRAEHSACAVAGGAQLLLN